MAGVVLKGATTLATSRAGANKKTAGRGTGGT